MNFQEDNLMGVRRPDARWADGPSNELAAAAILEMKIEMPQGIKRVRDVPATIEGVRRVVREEMRGSL